MPLPPTMLGFQELSNPVYSAGGASDGGPLSSAGQLAPAPGAPAGGEYASSSGGGGASAIPVGHAVHRLDMPPAVMAAAAAVALRQQGAAAVASGRPAGSSSSSFASAGSRSDGGGCSDHAGQHEQQPQPLPLPQPLPSDAAERLMTANPLFGADA